MKLSPKLLNALNEQMNFEYLSERVYLTVAAFFDSINLDNLKALMLTQAVGENFHARKFYDYILDRLALPELSALGTFPYKLPSKPSEALALVYEHEQKVTERIHKLSDLSEQEGDHATCQFLLWFIQEQVEEERTAEKYASLAKSLKDDPVGILLLDHEAK